VIVGIIIINFLLLHEFSHSKCVLSINT